ncbi:MAG: hypothetical protein CME64_16765 [Halobacteriovoraceae bacterium]|nr:hypothetical protein [Halobacteriovoraceae bacterium]|tara:strand:- start:180675 stop:181709 length:1035 start_codon:yes stop_codon:yes gene_type:complete
MNKQLERILTISSKNSGPVLSAFLNLKDVDHSLKKIRSLFVKCKNELEKSGQSISKIDKLLEDNLVSGNELQLDSGLKDVNIALYVFENEIISIKVNRHFEDQYCINQHPFILPLLRNNLSDIKAIVINRNMAKVFNFENDNLNEVESNLSLIDDKVDEYDNQSLPDRNNDRKEQFVKSYLKNFLSNLEKSIFKKDDKLLFLTNEEYLSPLKSYMENSQWKKNFIVEKHNFPTKELGPIKERIEQTIKKNKMAHFRPASNNRQREYHSLNTIRKEVDIYNMQSFIMKDSLIGLALSSMDRHQDLNQFILSLIRSSVQVSTFENLKENFIVEVKNIQDRSFIAQA